MKGDDLVGWVRDRFALVSRFPSLWWSRVGGCSSPRRALERHLIVALLGSLRGVLGRVWRG